MTAKEDDYLVRISGRHFREVARARQVAICIIRVDNLKIGRRCISNALPCRQRPLMATAYRVRQAHGPVRRATSATTAPGANAALNRERTAARAVNVKRYCIVPWQHTSTRQRRTTTRYTHISQYNYTRSAQSRNAENLVILHDETLAGQYAANWRRHADHSPPFEARLADTSGETRRHDRF